MLQRDLAGALDVGRSRLEAEHVRMVGPQLARVLDQHQPLGRVDQPEQRGQQGGLARPGPAADQEREPATRRSPQQPRRTAGLTDPAATRSASEKARADGTRSEIVVPGRAVGASTAWKRVPSGSRTSAYGRGVVEPPPAGRRQPLRESPHGRVVAEPDRRQPQPVTVVDPDLVGAVDEHVGDAGQSQQRLERPRTERRRGAARRARPAPSRPRPADRPRAWPRPRDAATGHPVSRPAARARRRPAPASERRPSRDLGQELCDRPPRGVRRWRTGPRPRSTDSASPRCSGTSKATATPVADVRSRAEQPRAGATRRSREVSAIGVTSRRVEATPPTVAGVTASTQVAARHQLADTSAPA